MGDILNFLGYLLNHSLVKSSAVVFIGSMLANVGAYLYHLILGRILGPVYYGELAALLSLLNILNVPSSVLQTVLVKYFSTLKAGNKVGQVRSLFSLATSKILVGEIIIFLIVFPLFPYLIRFLKIERVGYLVWLYLIFASFLLGTINGSLLQAFQFFKLSTILVNLGMVLRLVLGVIFAFYGVGWVLVSNIFSNLLAYGFSFWPIRFLFKVKPSKITLSRRHVASYSIPTFLTTLGITALYSQDVVLVKHFFSAETAGIYSSLSILGRVIFFATTAVSFVVFPVISQYQAQRRSYFRLALFSLGAVALISFGITALYFLFPALFVNLLFGRLFVGAIPYMGWFGLFISFFSLSSLLTTICLAAGKTLVWFFVIIAALGQMVLISFYHDSLLAVTINNLVVASSLFFLLLVYFAYAKRQA
ncbi:MAG: oligosaccharide flippase family protein [Patescibacteria group bacterium]